MPAEKPRWSASASWTVLTCLGSGEKFADLRERIRQSPLNAFCALRSEQHKSNGPDRRNVNNSFIKLTTNKRTTIYNL